MSAAFSGKFNDPTAGGANARTEGQVPMKAE
jgi:hypothetical protein